MADGSANLGGRPPHEPTPITRKQARTLSGYGIPEDEIARSIGISKPTLLKHYRAELDEGITRANSLVAESLFRKATGDGTSAVTAAIFWLKTRARWKEPPSEHEIAGRGGGPIRHIDLSRATNEQLAALEAVFGPLAGSGVDDCGDPRGKGEEEG